MTRINSKFLMVALAAVLLGWGAAPVRAQNGSGRGTNGNSQSRSGYEDRMKDLLGATPEEWEILRPRIERVQQLQRASSVGRSGFSLLFGNGNNNGGGRGRRGFGGTNGNQSSSGGEATPSPVEEKAKELQTAVENKTSTEEYKIKLAALREAKARVKADLAHSQDELRDLCTVRQEVILVLLGILE